MGPTLPIGVPTGQFDYSVGGSKNPVQLFIDLKAGPIKATGFSYCFIQPMEFLNEFIQRTNKQNYDVQNISILHYPHMTVVKYV